MCSSDLLVDGADVQGPTTTTPIETTTSVPASTMPPTVTTVHRTTTPPNTTPPSTSSTTTTTTAVNSNQVDVIVTPFQTASGVVGLEVRKKTATTADFVVKVSGPGLTYQSSTTSAFSKTFQSLTSMSTYIVTVTFVGGGSITRNFQAP